MLSNRISVFISLPMAKLERLTLQKRLDAIGTDTATPASTGSAT